MRPLEFLLLSVVVADALWLIIPNLRPSFSSNFNLAVPVVALVQLMIEGFRWQMVPAYALVVTFFLIWVRLPTVCRYVNNAQSALGVALVLSLLAVTAIAIVLPAILPVFRFPKPSGQYRIGTVTYHWIEKRHEIFSKNPGDVREFMAQIWYPARGNNAAARAPYVQNACAISSTIGRATHLPRFILDHLQLVTTNAIPSLPMAADRSTYPVIVFLTGVDGFRQSNTFQVENLVSHGYIVVGIDQPFVNAAVTFPDGRVRSGWTRADLQPFIDQSLRPIQPSPKINAQMLERGLIPYLAQDVGITLDELTTVNRNDPNRILTGHLGLDGAGIFGVSLGAMTAAEACHTEPRLKACIMMDAAVPADVVRSGLQQPAMWLTRPANDMRRERWKEPDISLTLNSMRQVFNKARADSYFVQIAGMFHANFTDAPYYSPAGHLMGLTGAINGRRGLDILNAYTLAFFDKELLGKPQPLLNEASASYPEVTIEKR